MTVLGKAVATAAAADAERKERRFNYFSVEMIYP
jgi:hypothetical protein